MKVLKGSLNVEDEIYSTLFDGAHLIMHEIISTVRNEWPSERKPDAAGRGTRKNCSLLKSYATTSVALDLKVAVFTTGVGLVRI